MSEEKRPTRATKHLKICPKCTGYMRLQAPFEGRVGTQNWKDESYHRSFGGVEMQRFVCEKCGLVEVFQIDDLGHIGEDD